MLWIMYADEGNGCCLEIEVGGNTTWERVEVEYKAEMADAVNTLPMADKTEETVNNKDLLFKQFLSLVGSSNGRIRSVTAFAEMLNITPKYLSVVVREVSGQTPTHWIKYYVVNIIAQRLTQTNKTVKEISVELDFLNPSFFGRFVKEHLGCSPLEYREKFS